MKKIIIGLVAIVLVVVAVCFTLRSNVNSKIDAKIEELKNNGFNVNIEKKNIPLKIEANGKIEVAYSEKALNYLVSLQDEGEFKKSLEQFLKIIDKKIVDESLEGLSFDYDFRVNLLNSKLDLNIYLAKLSNSLMQEILANKDDKALQSLNDMLNNRDFQINFDENMNYKVKDINYIAPDGSITIRGIAGDKKNLNLDLLKLSSKTDNFNISFENIKTFYEESANKSVNSKFNIGSLNIYDDFADLKLKNILISSFSKVIDDFLEGDSKISFEDLMFKGLKDEKNETNIKNSSLEITFNKIPFKQYEDFINIAGNTNENAEKITQKAKEFLEALSKAGINLSLNLNSKDLNFQGTQWFKDFILKSNFAVSKNLSEMKFEGINDIFEAINVDLKVDKDSASKIVENLNLTNMKIELSDSEDKLYKVLNINLKDDGLYANNNLVLPKEALKFPNKSKIDDETLGYEDEDNNISYNYKLLDKNTLRVNFKYKSSLNKINSGGISVSFPQLKDDSLIISKTSKNFKKLDVYKEKDTIYSGLLGKNLTATYLMIEGFDENWTNIDEEKEFSLDIDVSKMDDFLEVNLRGYSSNVDDDYELVPSETTSSTQDQQTYYVKIADIDLEEEKDKLK